MEQTTDTLADRQGARWNHILVSRQMSHATDTQMDMSCWSYEKQTSHWIHLNHVTPPLSAVG